MSEKIRLTANEKPRIPELDPQDAVRFCPKCGREIPLDRGVCVFCAEKELPRRPDLTRKKKLLILGVIILCFFLLLLTTLCLTRHTGLK